MPPRSLASLAHALGASSDLDGALIALGDCLAELDRGAGLALLKYDARKEMLRERLSPANGQVTHSSMETTFAHLPDYGSVCERDTAGGDGMFRSVVICHALDTESEPDPLVIRTSVEHLSHRAGPALD